MVVSPTPSNQSDEKDFASEDSFTKEESIVYAEEAKPLSDNNERRASLNMDSPTRNDLQEEEILSSFVEPCFCKSLPSSVPTVIMPIDVLAFDGNLVIVGYVTTIAPTPTDVLTINNVLFCEVLDLMSTPEPVHIRFAEPFTVPNFWKSADGVAKMFYHQIIWNLPKYQKSFGCYGYKVFDPGGNLFGRLLLLISC